MGAREKDVLKILVGARLSMRALADAGIEQGTIQLGCDWTLDELRELARRARLAEMHADLIEHPSDEPGWVIDGLQAGASRYAPLRIAAQGKRRAPESSVAVAP